MTAADDDRISQALGPDWGPFLAIARQWYAENVDRLRQGWDIPIAVPHGRGSTP